MDLLDSWWAIIRDGLYHIHPIQFVIIGLLFGWMTSSVFRFQAGTLHLPTNHPAHA